MATMSMLALLALTLIAAAPSVQGRYMLAGKEPTSASSATAAPSDDDTSTIEDNVTFLNSGKGTPTAKQTARNDINAAVGRLGSPTSMAQATTTPSNDDASVIEHSTTALEGKGGTPTQNAKSAQDLTAAANRISAAAGVTAPSSPKPTKKPTSKPAGGPPTAAFTPGNDDSSTIENAVTYLNSGKGNAAGKHAARKAFNRAGSRLGSKEAIAEAAGTPNNDDGSVIERSTTALESKTGTPSQNAASVAALSKAVNHLSAEAAGASAAAG